MNGFAWQSPCSGLGCASRRARSFACPSLRPCQVDTQTWSRRGRWPAAAAYTTPATVQPVVDRPDALTWNGPPTGLGQIDITRAPLPAPENAGWDIYAMSGATRFESLLSGASLKAITRSRARPVNRREPSAPWRAAWRPRPRFAWQRSVKIRLAAVPDRAHQALGLRERARRLPLRPRSATGSATNSCASTSMLPRSEAVRRTLSNQEPCQCSAWTRRASCSRVSTSQGDSECSSNFSSASITAVRWSRSGIS